MATCTYCKRSYPEHKGLVVYTFDGKTIRYCSSKCRRNNALGRDPKKVNWIKREKKKGKVGKVVKEKPVEEKKVKEKVDKEKEKKEEVKKEEKKSEKK